MEVHVPIGRAERIAMETRRSREIELSYRNHRRFLIRSGLILLAWNLVGLVLMGMSFHLETQRYANLLFQLSFFVGYGGVFFSAVFIYVRGRETGEFE